MAPVHKTKESDGEHGYDVQLCDPNAFHKYKCPFCKYVIRNPIQTERGQLACEHCYDKAERDDGRCPIDGEPLSEVFKDKAKQKDISKQPCYCRYTSLGCTWKGELQYFQDHLEECEYKAVNCPICHQEVHQSHLSFHVESCPELLANGCIYKGCPYKPKNMEALREHLKDEVLFHASLYSSAIMDLQEQVNHQSSLLENLMKENEKRDEERESQMKAMQLQLSEMSEMMTSVMTHMNNQITIINDRIEQLEKSKTERPDIESLQTDVERLSNDVTEINKNMAEVDLRWQLFENTTYEGKLVWKIDNVTMRVIQAMSNVNTALHSAPTFTHRNGYKFCARLYLNGDGIGKDSHVSLFFVLMKSEYDNLLTWPFTRTVSFKLFNQKKGGRHFEESFVPDVNSSSFAQPKKEMNIASGCPTFINLIDFQNGGYIKDDCVFIEVQVTAPKSRKNSPVRGLMSSKKW